MLAVRCLQLYLAITRITRTPSLSGMTDVQIGAYNQIYLLALMTSQNGPRNQVQQLQAIEGNSENAEGGDVVDEKFGAFHFLRNLPIALPIRSKQEVMDAHDKLFKGSVMSQMVGALVKVVETARSLEDGTRKHGNDNSRLCNAMISRFDLPYFATVSDVHQQKPPSWYLHNLERLPLGRCYNLKVLYQAALRKLGKDSKRDKKKYVINFFSLHFSVVTFSLPFSGTNRNLTRGSVNAVQTSRRDCVFQSLTIQGWKIQYSTNVRKHS